MGGATYNTANQFAHIANIATSIAKIATQSAGKALTIPSMAQSPYSNLEYTT
jgi:hypothetical protein